MHPLWSESPVFTRGHFPGSTVARPAGEAFAGHRSAVICGRDEAGHSEGGTGTDQGDGRTETYDRPFRFNSGNCCVDHCCCSTRKGAGHQQTVASFDISRLGQYRTGENDPRKDCALVQRVTRNPAVRPATGWPSRWHSVRTIALARWPALVTNLILGTDGICHTELISICKYRILWTRMASSVCGLQR